MKTVRFAYTIVYVPDVERTIAFFEEAFGLKRRFIGDDGSYGELDTGVVILSFASETLAASNLPEGFQRQRPDALPFSFVVAFATEDVPGAVERAIEAGATLAAEPVDKLWGQTVAYVRDPNGMLIEICTPMAS